MGLDLGPPDGIPGEPDIEQLEQKLGLKLPSRYRALLPRLNGARPEPHFIQVGSDRYAINLFELIEDIFATKQAIDSENPSDLLLVLFANDNCGNWFCIAAAEGARHGAVYFVDHEIPGDDAFTRIADNLDQLMHCAMPDDTDMDDPQAEDGEVWAKPGFLEWLKQREDQDAARRAQRNTPGIPYTPSPKDDFPG